MKNLSFIFFSSVMSLLVVASSAMSSLSDYAGCRTQVLCTWQLPYL